MHFVCIYLAFLALHPSIALLSTGILDYKPEDSCTGVALWNCQCCTNGEYYGCMYGPSGVIEYGGNTGGDCVSGIVYCDWDYGCVPDIVMKYNAGTGDNALS